MSLPLLGLEEEKNKNPHDQLDRQGKVCDKIQHSFLIKKTFSKPEIKRNFLDLITVIKYSKLLSQQ